ncbi:MAG: sulfatase-like hydrolase/transferase [Phycisphaera sp.]|nr:sulfatase-like hydrolase/transferase [Phycisphaera sp.]
MTKLNRCLPTRWVGILIALCAACVIAPERSAHGASDRPPNFVLIFADDLGYGDLGCYGSELIRTPRIDRMAKEGMRFTNFYAQPICGPSRTAIMTGCYPLRVAERHNIKQIHPIVHSKEITIAEVLKQKNYATACFGKWDLAKHSQTDFYPELMPNHQGFDYFYGTPTSNDAFANLYRNEELIEPKTNLSTITKRYTDEAIGFIEKHRDEPFFVYLPHSMPHVRLAASDDFRGKSKRGLYGDVVEELDFNVGRLLDALERMKLVDNTYVIFTSDNGPWLIKNKDHRDGIEDIDHGGSAGPLRSGKVSTWDGGERVPCIVWAPGRVPAGTTCENVAATIDMLPTFAAMAGASPPTDRVIDGVDIRPLFAGEFDKADPERVFYFYMLNHLRGVRVGQWKLHAAMPEHPKWLGPFAVNKHIAPEDDIGFAKPALFDLASDIGETRDVAAEHPDVVKKLSALLDAAREDIGDYDRVGKNARFFDPYDERPKVFDTAYAGGSRRPKD